jgi:hypothetical protein
MRAERRTGRIESTIRYNFSTYLHGAIIRFDMTAKIKPKKLKRVMSIPLSS